ncbi:hypothetical protein BDF22DRAFT_743926 [Syncephalis plumigaleata]|nr:hypothetical protein BDF22DRAFT_743926 [Syncephalis plumigaleata]
MTRLACNRATLKDGGDSDIIEIQKKLLMVINQMKPVFQQHLSLNTAVDEGTQKHMLIQIKELYDTTHPVILLKAIALMLKLSSQKAMEEQGYKALWATIEDRLQAHIQLFADIKRLEADSKELTDHISQGETALRQAIANIYQMRNVRVHATRISGLEKAIKILQARYLDHSSSITRNPSDETRQSMEGKSLIYLMKIATTVLRDRISQLSLQTSSICQQTTAPLAPLLVKHEQDCWAAYLRVQQDIQSKLRNSLLNHRVQTDPAIIEFYNAIHFRPYQTLQLMPDYLGSLGATVIKQHAIETEQQQLIAHLQQSSLLHVNQILQLPLLADKHGELAAIDRETRYPTVKLLTETIHNKDYNQLEQIQHRLSSALENTRQSEMLCDVINEVYTARELFYSGKIADNWLRIQGYRFAELVHDQSNVD